MGYHTEFSGQVTVVPPLNPYEGEYLDRFAETRHVYRRAGPYVVGGDIPDNAVLDVDRPPPELPGYWCQWVPAAAGDALVWNGAENFRDAEKWLAYLVGAFLEPAAAVRRELADPVAGRFYPAVFRHFGFDHTLNGKVYAAGEEPDDRWRIEVRDNVVHVIRLVSFPEYSDIDPRDPGEWGTAQWGEFEARTLRNRVSVVENGRLRDVGPAVESGFDPVAG